jgi:hypothetical protein
MRKVRSVGMVQVSPGGKNIEWFGEYLGTAK